MIKLYVVKRLNLVNDPPYCCIHNDRIEWYHGIHKASFFALAEAAFVLKNQLDGGSTLLKHSVLELECEPTPVELFTKQVEEE